MTPGVEKQKTKRLSVNSRLTGVTTTRNAQEILLTSIGFYIQSVTHEMRNEKRDDEKWCKFLPVHVKNENWEGGVFQESPVYLG